MSLPSIKFESEGYKDIACAIDENTTGLPGIDRFFAFGAFNVAVACAQVQPTDEQITALQVWAVFEHPQVDTIYIYVKP